MPQQQTDDGLDREEDLHLVALLVDTIFLHLRGYWEFAEWLLGLL